MGRLPTSALGSIVLLQGIFGRLYTDPFKYAHLMLPSRPDSFHQIDSCPSQLVRAPQTGAPGRLLVEVGIVLRLHALAHVGAEVGEREQAAIHALPRRP